MTQDFQTGGLGVQFRSDFPSTTHIILALGCVGGVFVFVEHMLLHSSAQRAVEIFLEVIQLGKKKNQLSLHTSVCEAHAGPHVCTCLAKSAFSGVPQVTSTPLDSRGLQDDGLRRDNVLAHLWLKYLIFPSFIDY